MDIQWGDVATWAAAPIAVVSAGTAIWQAKGARTARDETVTSAKESAEAAKRSAVAAEQTLAFQRDQARAAAPPAVAWRIEHLRDLAYRLRNVGTDTATGVTAEDPRGADLARQLPQNATIAAQAAHEIILIVVDAYPDPSELLVRWDGVDEPVVVPVPRG